MTVTVSADPVRYVGNGVTDTFPFLGVIFDSSDLEVTYEKISDDSITVKTLDLDYTVTGIGRLNGGNVVTTTPVPATHRIAIRVSVAATQPTSIRNQSNFLPETHEQAFDRVTRILQKHERILAQTFRLPALGVADDLDELISKAAFAGKYLAGDGVGNPIPASGTGNDSALRTDLANGSVGTDGARLSTYRRNATGSVARTLASIFDRTVRLLDFGADPTGVADCTTAFNNAIAACAALNHTTLWCDAGEYRFASAPNPIGYGIMIDGPGSQGSTQSYGFGFTLDYNGEFLKWDGTGGAGFRGTGGGLRNCRILVANGRTAAHGIWLYATDDDHRPGEMLFENVLLSGLGTGTFTAPFEIDGRNANTVGTKGVRTTHFKKVRLSNGATNNKYLWLRQVTHVYGDIQMDTVGGGGTLGMTIDDDWDHIYLMCRVGNIVVNYTGAGNPTCWFGGSCDTLDVNDTKIIGTYPIKATNGITVAGKLTSCASWINDRFQAVQSATLTNLTGDGTQYTVLFDNEIFDRNSTYNPATGIATIKVGGFYEFHASVLFQNLGAAHTTGEMLITHRDSGGSLISSNSFNVGIGPMRNAANQCSISDIIGIECSEGDTVRVIVQVSGSTKTVGIIGAATRYTKFSGKHIP